MERYTLAVKGDQPPIDGPGLPTERVTVGNCPNCGYDLKSLALPGRCPECGSPYLDGALRWARNLPGPFEAVVRFGWPVLGFALCAITAATAFEVSTALVGLALGVLFVIAILINTYVQVRILRRRLEAPVGIKTDANRRVRIMSPLVVVLIVISLTLPVVMFGACFKALWG